MAHRRPRQEYGTSGRAGSWGAYRRLDNAEKIAVPLSIVHGEKNSRVPVLVSEALRFVGHRMRERRRGTDGVRVGRPRCRTGSTGYSRETDAQRFFLSSLRIRVQAETRHRIVRATVRVDAQVSSAKLQSDGGEIRSKSNSDLLIFRTRRRRRKFVKLALLTKTRRTERSEGTRRKERREEGGREAGRA